MMGAFANGSAVSTTMHVKETELHYLVGKSLKTAFSLPQNTLFFEVPVAGSRADILYVQTPAPYETALNPGIHVFEVKMRWDNDKQRLSKQLSDYTSSADYVWVVGVNKIIEPGDENVGVLAFSTLSCKIRTVRPALAGRRVNLGNRQEILENAAGKLLRKYKLISDMARVNPVGERMLLVQEKLGVCDGKDG
ncbi:MAG: hypothetical protein ABH851_09335 [Methanobacteriota archaeon]